GLAADAAQRRAARGDARGGGALPGRLAHRDSGAVGVDHLRAGAALVPLAVTGPGNVARAFLPVRGGRAEMPGPRDAPLPRFGVAVRRRGRYDQEPTPKAPVFGMDRTDSSCPRARLLDHDRAHFPGETFPPPAGRPGRPVPADRTNPGRTDTRQAGPPDRTDGVWVPAAGPPQPPRDRRRGFAPPVPPL